MLRYTLNLYHQKTHRSMPTVDIDDSTPSKEEIEALVQTKIYSENNHDERHRQQSTCFITIYILQLNVRCSFMGSDSFLLLCGLLLFFQASIFKIGESRCFTWFLFVVLSWFLYLQWIQMLWWLWSIEEVQLMTCVLMVCVIRNWTVAFG